MHGRKPKPTKIKRLEGNPGKRPLPAREPVMADLRDGGAPEWLDELGQEEWARVLGAAPKGLVTAGDVSALGALCQAYSNMRRAISALGAEGWIAETPNGHKQPSAWATIERQNRQDYMRACAEFGLTPSSRSRVSLGAEEADSNEERMFGA